MRRRDFLAMGVAAGPILVGGRAAMSGVADGARGAQAQGAAQTEQGTAVARPILFLAHRLGTDHAEAVAIMDMNGDGRPDITSGAYWYENPGAAGGSW
jgi:hypothetical protein